MRANHRLSISIVLVVIVCATLAQTVSIRLGRARLIEEATNKIVLLMYFLRGSGELNELISQQGVESVWISDGSGVVVAHEGSTVDNELIRSSVGSKGLRTRRYGSQSISISLPMVVAGYMGCIFSPKASADALSSGSAMLPIVIALLALAALLVALKGNHATCNSPFPLPGRPRKDDLACPSHLSWARAAADTIPHPVMLLDVHQAICAANVAAHSICGGLEKGPHLLDLAKQYPWGRVALHLLERVNNTSATTAHDAGRCGNVSAVSVAKLEHDGRPVGYWLSLEG